MTELLTLIYYHPVTTLIDMRKHDMYFICHYILLILDKLFITELQMFIDLSSTCKGSEKDCHGMDGIIDHGSSAILSPDHFFAPAAKDPSEFKLLKPQTGITRSSKNALRTKIIYDSFLFLLNITLFTKMK